MTAQEISTMLGYSSITRNVRKEIDSLVSEGVLRYLYPDKPRSPKQRICLSVTEGDTSLDETSDGKGRM